MRRRSIDQTGRCEPNSFDTGAPNLRPLSAIFTSYLQPINNRLTALRDNGY
jgi:hypothetical protein